MRRNTEVEAALLLAHRFDGGVLPLPALLAPVKRTLLARWGRRYLPGVAADPAALVAKLRSRLAAEPPLAGRFCWFCCCDQVMPRRTEWIGPPLRLLTVH